MPPRHHRLKKQARSLIESVGQPGPMDAAQRRELAESARQMAVEAGDLILEAEALLSRMLLRTPLADPLHVLASLQRAGQIFVANGLRQRAATCRIAAASALFDAGEEAESMRQAELALLELDLPAADQVHAHLLCTQGLLHLGDIDAALQRIEVAAPLAAATSQPALSARVHWVKALAHTFLLVAKHFPDLWFSLPSKPRTLAPPVKVENILAWLDAGQDLLRDAHPWPYIGLCRDFVRALFLDEAAAAIRLRDLSARHLETDPPLSLRALLCLSLVRRRDQRHRDVLEMLNTGQAIAQRLGLKGLSRSLSLHQAKVFEALGDTPQALAAYKQYAEGVVLSLRRSTGDGPSEQGGHCGAGSEFARELGQISPPEQPLLRHLEPAYLRRAVRFVEDKVLECLRVSDLVAHCGVSRRTLEMAFKEFRSTTVAEFIAARKMERAAAALLHTGLSVKDVAASIGYRSASAFSREFRTRMGTQPTEWRRARQGKSPPPA